MQPGGQSPHALTPAKAATSGTHSLRGLQARAQALTHGPQQHAQSRRQVTGEAGAREGAERGADAEREDPG